MTHTTATADSGRPTVLCVLNQALIGAICSRRSHDMPKTKGYEDAIEHH